MAEHFTLLMSKVLTKTSGDKAFLTRNRTQGVQTDAKDKTRNAENANMDIFRRIITGLDCLKMSD